MGFLELPFLFGWSKGTPTGAPTYFAGGGGGVSILAMVSDMNSNPNLIILVGLDASEQKRSQDYLHGPKGFAHAPPCFNTRRGRFVMKLFVQVKTNRRIGS